ncbi:AIPR family protein [Pedobacter cryotolerans]|uniref:Abortive phage infection protein n=1 Tax=Pedobacter cryotolerans TaxID=2571270 RepID=A0A4U1BV62_9SPHI|nr:AIPR family protein [Pedobacter cryotolerans]TKB96657.1 abortive phage infection protein [Pedobacter cryotolerans]
MEIEEFLKFRKNLLKEACDSEGFVNQNQFMTQTLPLMYDAKLIDSEECNESYYVYNEDNLKINGYAVNDSGERLQLFLVDEAKIDLAAKAENLSISTKAYYESQFKRATRFVNKAIKGHLNDELQLSSPVRALVAKMASAEGTEQFDVVEVFLISATATIETRGSTPQPKKFDFEDEELSVSFSKNRSKVVKNVLIIKRLIDLNFLYNVEISRGQREALVIDFEKDFNYRIEAIKAADEEHFESYLCVLPATILADLYRKYSTRLLEKNVRSFLQFKGANAGIRETIRLTPEKFIAFNNGITITSTGKTTLEKEGKVYISSLTDFQIVNGGQTTASIFFTRKDGFSIEKVRVMAKINVAKNVTEEGLDDLISKISRYSNSQTKVSTVDLGSRNPQLTKIKALSDSVMMPSGKKWFFEKSKGEFSTLLRMGGKAEKDYPKDVRFSKEQLGKYFTAWGDQPYVVKKGGDKVFKYFIDALSGDENGKGKLDIDRNFYEMLISKVIIFKKLEDNYGQGKNAIGQIRSAVVPYSISILYKFTDGSKNGIVFDLSKIWLKGTLEDDLSTFMSEMMILMNNLIKKYALSDDLGEYSKRKELWDNISQSSEITNYMESSNAQKILEKYTITKEALKAKLNKKSKQKFADLATLKHNVLIFSRTADYYKKLGLIISGQISQSQRNKIDHIINCIVNKNDITDEYLSFENELIHLVRSTNPETFDKIEISMDESWQASFDLITSIYNNCLEQSENILSSFQRQREIVKAKGAKFYSVYDEIGKLLNEGKSPSIKHLFSVRSTLNKSMDA